MSPDSRDFRTEALLTAVRTCATVVTDLLARHPRADELRQRADDEPPPLAQLLWDELVAAELTPPAIAARWRDAYARSARSVQGTRIVSALGRSLLAAMFRRLTAEQRQTAARLSRSSLPAILADDEFLEPATPEELALGES